MSDPTAMPQDPAWYYTDAHGRRQGPMAADGLLAAYREGSLPPGGLVWREGMALWLPLERCEGELGIGAGDHAAARAALGDAPPPVPPVRSKRAIDREDVVYAGLLRRCAALMVDKFLIMVPLVAAAILVLRATRFNAYAEDTESAFNVVFFGGWMLLTPLYFVFQEASHHQATIGKRLFGIKVTDRDGWRLTFPRALARWFAALLSYAVFFAGFLMAGITHRKRALHDMLAGTLVVDRWAYTDMPERQLRGAPLWAIAALLGPLPLVLPFAAAIVIPVYADYRIRSQFTEAATLADRAKSAVASYYAHHGTMPSHNVSAGLPEPERITGQYVTGIVVSDGVVVVSFGNQADPAIRDGLLVYAPHPALGGPVAWDCNARAGTTIQPKYRPLECRFR